jgi:hypothetical protein
MNRKCKGVERSQLTDQDYHMWQGFYMHWKWCHWIPIAFQSRNWGAIKLLVVCLDQAVSTLAVLKTVKVTISHRQEKRQPSFRKSHVMPRSLMGQWKYTMETLSDYFFSLNLIFSFWKVSEGNNMTTLRCDMMIHRILFWILCEELDLILVKKV